MKRSTVLILVVSSVVAAATVGWLFGSRIKSPAEIAAEAAPPEPSNITVDVVETELSADIVTRGDIVYDQPVSLSLSGSFAVTPESLVVTKAKQVDDELTEGGVAVEVVGRPVLILAGDLPMFRDLRPGAIGDDVLQLEEALARLGFFEGTPDDRWDPATGSAVAAWYAEHGYLPNGMSADDEQALRGARDRVRGAQGLIADLQAALRDAQQGAGQAALTQARAEVSRAEDALTLARLDADRANSLAIEAVNAATANVTAAEAALAQAEAELAAAPPAEQAAAQAAVDAARVALQDARHVLDDAGFDRTRTSVEQEALVRAASDAVAVAKAALADLQRGADTSALQRQITTAGQELTDAQRDLADLESRLGTWLPAGEVVFVRRLPVRVNQVTAGRGDVISSSFLVVSGSELSLRSSVAERDAARVEMGMAVRIEHPGTGEFLQGVVSAKAERAGTNNVAADRVYLEIEPESLPSEIIGSNVRIVIPVSSTGGRVLAVPNAALSATADGTSILQVEEPGGRLRTVRVEPGLSAGGLVEVTPVEGALAVGDRVVVGRDGSSTGLAPVEETEAGEG